MNANPAQPGTTIRDPQIDAVIKAGGHTFEDACRFLTELNRIGWTVRPITPVTFPPGVQSI